MKVVVRVDASQHIGSGHVMRCLVLAQALKLAGHNVIFATREQESNLNDFIRNKGFKLIDLVKPKTWRTPTNTADYSAWLQVSECQDSQDFISKVGSADLVIVDHYGINKFWHERVKSKLGCALMVIDDLVREHSATILLDQTLNRQPSEYTGAYTCTVLSGTDYALLKPGFSEIRKYLKKQIPQEHEILITMGGIDMPNSSLKVLKALSKETKKIPTTVLLSQRSPNYSQVKEFAAIHASWVKHIEFVDDMAELMSKFSIAIGAPGSTSWERACLGIPSILVPIAQNQNMIATELEKAHAAILINLNDIDSELPLALNRIITDWQTYSNNSFALCDGKGCERAVNKIEEVIGVC